LVLTLVFAATVAFAAPAEVTYGGAKFLAQNIGETDMGKVKVDGTKIVMTGCGADVWGTADAFYYMYKEVTGDFTATVKVTQVSDADPWAKMGIMVRSTTEAGSPHAMIVATNQNNMCLQYRPEVDGESLSVSGEDTYENGTPIYLQLARKGDLITTAYSLDGKAWTAIAPAEDADPVKLAGKAFIGVMHTSHNAEEVGVDGEASDFVVK
jgi:regulation of enolase protein 1 (concanavalin A-like superfamily)